MSSISSGIGLVTGLPISDIVDKLISAQSGQLSLIDTRLRNITSTRTALLDLSARLLAFKSALSIFKTAEFFSTSKATSSNDSIFRATADATASVGDYAFTVRQLAATHQAISNSFTTADQSTLSAGTITIESAAARLDRSSALNVLRGGQGVRGGVIRITDRSGATADIDLTIARTVEDVTAAINNQSAVRVRARVRGDSLVLDDQTGLSTGSLTVADLNNGHAAADLGLAGTSAAGQLTGADLVSLSSATRLDLLNDGNGVRRGNGAGDFTIALADGTAFTVDLSGRLTTNTPLALLNGGAGVTSGSIRVTNRQGVATDIDLSGAKTVGDVLSAINGANAGVSAGTVDASIVLTDTTTGTGSLTVSDLSGGTTASDLGIAGASTTATLRGATVLRIETLGDVINAINKNPANGGKLVASISAGGKSLVLTDTTSGAGTLTITPTANNNAAADLGLLNPAIAGTITSGRLLAGLDTVLLSTLRGGRGVGAGTFKIADGSGQTAQINVTQGQTLAELIDAINNAGTGLQAAIDESGLGILVTDGSGGGGAFSIRDVSGSVAGNLGIASTAATGTLRGGNLQRRYISEATRLDQLDSGRGVPRGKFKITSAAGTSAIVDLTQGNETTLQDVIDEINSRGINVSARINDSGDGLLLTDASGGAGQFKVEEDSGGTTAKALHILGTAAAGTTTLDGSFETHVSVTNADTLSTLQQKIRASGAAVTASIIGDGSAGGGFRLNITSQRSGAAGRLALDAGATGLTFNTLVRGRDAAVQIGGSDAGEPIIVTSSSNTVLNAVSGIRLDLLAVSSQPVTVSVTRDTKAITDKLSALAQAYNSVVSRIDDLSKFDAATSSRGILLGDRSAGEVRGRLGQIVTRAVPGQPTRFSRLGSVGFSVSNGALAFDAAKFELAFSQNPDAVTTLFTQDATGLVAAISTDIDRLADSTNGSLTQRNQSLQKSADDLTSRKTQLSALLDDRRKRLLAQFQAAETTISKLQAQQSSLSSLANIAASFNLSSLGSSSRTG